MNRAALERLGLTVHEVDGVVEAELELTSGQAVNPLTRKPLAPVRFAVVGTQLLYSAPPELVGAPPINLAFVSSDTKLEDLVVAALTHHLAVVERKSAELAAMGIATRVEPTTLELSAEVSRGQYDFLIGANRQGSFRVIHARKEGAAVATPPDAVFELTELRNRRALEELLFALVDDGSRLLAPTPVPGAVPSSISFRELFEAFGDAQLPPRAGLELLADVRVGTALYRFACGRVQGRTFRGLLAGAKGKLWAERFDIDDFPGIRGLVAEVLSVSIDDVEVL